MLKPSFKYRRVAALTSTVIVSTAFLLLNQWVVDHLGHEAYFSGSSLFACIALLIVFGLRKRLVMLPLLSVATWTQIHIYTGLFSFVVYLAHVPSIIGNGMFEGGLSMLFLTVGVSGLYGVYISRTAPKKLTAVPGEFRFDQIPWHRQTIYDRATEVLKSLEANLASPVLANYFRSTLLPYFASGVSIDFLLVPNGMKRRRLLLGLNDIDRYLSPDVRSMSGQLAALVRKRDELDFHFAMQWKLRTWLAVHAAFSFVLLISSIVHIFLVLNFI